MGCREIYSSSQGILSGDIHDICDVCDICDIRDIHDICIYLDHLHHGFSLKQAEEHALTNQEVPGKYFRGTKLGHS